MTNHFREILKHKCLESFLIAVLRQGKNDTIYVYCVILGEFRLLYETQDYHNSNEATNLSVLYCLQFQACSMGLCVIDNNNVVQLKQILVTL